MKLKDIALSAAYVGQMVVKAICVGAQEIWSAVKYIVFADPVVAQICATNFGDGTGITEEQAAAVTSIGTVFKCNTEITSFNELGEFKQVTSLSASAFEGCNSLQSIDLSNIKANGFGNYALRNCTSLTTAILNPDTEYMLNHEIFGGCTSLTNIDISGIKRFYPNVFNGCPLQPIVTLRKANELHFDAFKNSGIEELYIDSPLSVFGDNVFSGSKLLRKIEFNEKCTFTTLNGLNNCPALKEVNIDAISRKIKKIANNAANGSPIEIEEMNLPNVNNTNLINSFVSCNIKRVNDIGKIAGDFSGAFSNNKNLKYAVMPYGVTSTFVCFNGCSSLETVLCFPTTPPALGTTFNSEFANAKVHVPNESWESYKSASGWSEKIDRISPLTDYITYEDITYQLVSDVIYNTPTEAFDVFNEIPISSVGAKSLIYDVTNYNYAKIKGTGGTDARLYCFIDENNKVVTTAEESIVASPALYIVIPKVAAKMIVNLSASSTEFEVKIGNHIEE